MNNSMVPVQCPLLCCLRDAPANRICRIRRYEYKYGTGFSVLVLDQVCEGRFMPKFLISTLYLIRYPFPLYFRWPCMLSHVQYEGYIDCAYTSTVRVLVRKSPGCLMRYGTPESMYYFPWLLYYLYYSSLKYQILGESLFIFFSYRVLYRAMHE